MVQFLRCATVLLIFLSFALSAYAGTANITVSNPGTGGVLINVTASLDTCDGSNSGNVVLYRNGSRIGTKTTYTGAIDYTWTQDLKYLHGEQTFTATLNECSGSTDFVTVVTFDNTPEITITSPASTLQGPFAVTGNATFKPSLSSKKGSMKLYVDNSYVSGISCYSTDCPFTYTNSSTDNLMDLSHGEHTITLLADTGYVSAEDELSVVMDKTPTIELTSPMDTVSGLFNITATGQFKPSLDGDYGSIVAYIDGSVIGSKNCDSEQCEFDYEEIQGQLRYMLHGSYELQVDAVANGVTASQTSTLIVDNTPTVKLEYPVESASSPFNIVGYADFKPTQSSFTGTLSVQLNTEASSASVLSCYSEHCVFNFEELYDHLMTFPQGGPYSFKLKATGGGATAVSEEILLIDEVNEESWPRMEDCLSKEGNSKFNIMTGAVKHQQQLFAAAGGQMPIHMELYYHSRDRLNGVLGVGWGFTYGWNLHENSNGTIVLTGSNQKHFYYPDGNGAYTNRKGDFSSLVKNEDDSHTLTFRNGDVYSFSATGQLTQIADRYGNLVILTYSDSQITITDPSGRTVYLDLDENGHIVTITDPDSNVFYLTYDDMKMLSQVIYPSTDIGSPTWTYQYNSGSYMTQKTDPEGFASTYSYNSDHKIVSSTNPDGLIKSLTYDYESTSFINDDGAEWTFTYDESEGTLTSQTDPDGNMTEYTYNTEGLMYDVVRPVGDGYYYITTYEEYDNYGNPTEITKHVAFDNNYIYPENEDPDIVDSAPDTHVVITYDNDHFDRITSIQNLMDSPATTVTLSYTDHYDGSQTVSVIDEEGNQTSFLLSVAGQLIEATDGAGRTTSYTYDTDGLLNTINYPSGTSVALSGFNILGYPGTIASIGSDASTHPITLTYDNLSQIISMVQQGSNQATTSFGYDLNGNRSTVTDPMGNQTDLEYNHKGQPTLISDGLMNETQLTYSGAGCPSCGSYGVDKLSSLTDANGHTTDFTYYSSGAQKRVINALGNAILYEYRADGALLEVLTGNSGNEQQTLSYDVSPNGRIEGKTDHITGEETAFTYYPNGRLKTAGNSAITYTLDYYDNGWLKTVTDSNGHTISYDSYNGAGQRTGVTLLSGSADQHTLTYSYDSAGRLSSLISSKAGAFGFSYDGRSRRSALTYPNGVAGAYAYTTDRDWLSSINYSDAAGSLIDIGYPQHDLVGNRLQRTQDGETTTFGYDDTYQVTSAANTTLTESYSYDPVGNRTAGPATSDTGYSHNSANQMLSGHLGTYTYDSRGNQVTRYFNGENWTLSWNGDNQLIQATNSSTTITFQYDPFGRRVKKQVIDALGTTTYIFVYDAEDIIAEYKTDASGATLTSYVHGPGIDEPLALNRDGQSYFYHADGLGSIVGITNENNEVVSNCTFGTFGERACLTGTEFESRYAFTGREWEEGLGLYYYRARYYDPAEGRFVGADPLSFAAGDVNLYRYVGNSPALFTDPSGKDRSIGGGFCLSLGILNASVEVKSETCIDTSGAKHLRTIQTVSVGLGLGLGIKGSGGASASISDDSKPQTCPTKFDEDSWYAEDFGVYGAIGLGRSYSKNNGQGWILGLGGGWIMYSGQRSMIMNDVIISKNQDQD